MRRLTSLAAASSILLLVGTAVPASADGDPLYRPATSYRVTQFGVSPTAEAIATGDLTGDGFADVAMTDESAGGVFVMPGAGDGTLSEPRRFATGSGADAVSTADLDGDQHLDLVVSNGLAGTVSVLFGDGSGGFVKHADYPVAYGAGAIVIRDFNRDGHLDFAVAAGPSSLFLGEGGRRFTAQPIAAGSSVVGLGAADLDGDGILDVVVGDGFPAKLHVLLGRGDGTFDAPDSYSVPGWVQEAFRLGDVSGDGTPDVVAVNSEGRGSVLLGRADGTLSPPRSFDSGRGSDGLEIADLNGDGEQDLAINDFGSSELAIHLGDGTGRFTKVESHPVVSTAESVAVVDLNGDGEPDLVAAPFIGPDISVLIHA